MNRRLKTVKRAVRRPFEWTGIALAWLVLAHLPRKAMLACCDLASFVGWMLDFGGRRLSRENLRIVLGRNLPPDRERKIIRRSYRNMMRTLGHIFWTSRRAAERIPGVIDMPARERETLASIRPAITVSAHLGCWEALSQMVYMEGREIVSVSKSVGSERMTELLIKSRRSLGQMIVRADGAFPHLYEGLKNGRDVGLLVDQVVKPQKGGVWVEYFGRPVPVSVAPAFLCAKTHVPVIVAWCRPLKDGRHRAELLRIFEWHKGLDVWGVTQEIASTLEGVIRRHPSAWVLNYRYFRKKPSEKELAQLRARLAKMRG